MLGMDDRAVQPARNRPMVLAAKCWNHREDDYDYSQPGLRFRLMSADQQAMLLANTVRAIGGVPREILIRHIGN